LKEKKECSTHLDEILEKNAALYNWLMDNMRWTSTSVRKTNLFWWEETQILTSHAAPKDHYIVDIMETGHQTRNDASAIISFNER
jgi:predicted DNA-binding ribbon-helix-helix protein